MAYTHSELKHKTLAELRDIAKDIEHEAIQGYTQLNKEHLIVALCKALNIEFHEHHEVVGVDKAAIKSRIKALKTKRDAAIAAHHHDPCIPSSHLSCPTMGLPALMRLMEHPGACNAGLFLMDLRAGTRTDHRCLRHPGHSQG